MNATDASKVVSAAASRLLETAWFMDFMTLLLGSIIVLSLLIALHTLAKRPAIRELVLLGKRATSALNQHLAEKLRHPEGPSPLGSMTAELFFTQFLYMVAAYMVAMAVCAGLLIILMPKGNNLGLFAATLFSLFCLTVAQYYRVEGFKQRAKVKAAWLAYPARDLKAILILSMAPAMFIGVGLLVNYAAP